MWRVIKITGIFTFLLFCSIQDIREQKISVKMIALSGCLFLTASLLFDNMQPGQRMWNLLPGLISFLLALLTKEQIGYGDAACLTALGVIIPADLILGAVMGGLILISIFSGILLTSKKADRKTTLPFLPFLSAGMVFQVVLNNI